MKILIVGGGGREHALAWRLAQSPSVEKLYAMPGNPGIAQLAECLPAPSDVAGYAEWAAFHSIDLTVVGPEVPLIAGIVDRFRERNIAIVGPNQAAARLEGSKLFAKAFFARAGIPTARTAPNLNQFSYPVVIKADGLAAGKGVTIAQHYDEAFAALARLGPNALIEEFLEGEEVSFIALSNGKQLLPFQPSQDHKRAYNGDRGPNTGGMGAYADSRILTTAQTGEIMERIMLPTLRQMEKEGTPFTGFLYAGLMMTPEGPKVLEFNVRLGDPETQALMLTYRGDLAELLLLAARGQAISAPPWASGTAVCVVLAASGYPETPRLGSVIEGIPAAEAEGVVVFQAGTKLSNDTLVTNGGRVLGVAARADTLNQSIANAYRAVHCIRFAGMHYREDIGQKGLLRW